MPVTFTLKPRLAMPTQPEPRPEAPTVTQSADFEPSAAKSESDSVGLGVGLGFEVFQVCITAFTASESTHAQSRLT